MISLMEAERIFIREARELKIDIGGRKSSADSARDMYREIQGGSNLSKRLSESELKRIYFQFAKIYHPDVQNTGDKTKFQKLTAAFDRLKADQAGYTLTDEDLFDMYKQ